MITKSKLYLSLLLATYVLIYLFRIDRDIFATQDYIKLPHQTFNEQLLAKKAAYFSEGGPGFSQAPKFQGARSLCFEHILAWKLHALSYDSWVNIYLKQNRAFDFSSARTFLYLRKQIIPHKSPDDEVLLS